MNCAAGFGEEEVYGFVNTKSKPETVFFWIEAVGLVDG